jgi:hypothetical protein
MNVNESFLSVKSEQPIPGFFLDENRCGSTGETRFDFLVRNKDEFCYIMDNTDDYRTNKDNGQKNSDIQKCCCFRPIQQSNIDNVNPSDPNPPNYGY